MAPLSGRMRLWERRVKEGIRTDGQVGIILPGPGWLKVGLIDWADGFSSCET